MKYYFLVSIFLMVSIGFGQSKFPIIRAKSNQVDIRDGRFLEKGAWTLSPEAKPDIYICDRTRESKWVVFYTDIDSIKFKVKPGSVFNFIILFNEKDSCYTQIRSAISSESVAKTRTKKSDTIPFVLSSYNAISVKSIINSTDTLNLHFDIGSTDFRLTKNTILKKTKLLDNQPDALSGKTKPDYNSMNKIHTLKIGSVVFNAPKVVPTGFTAHEMDGRFGWNIFEGKVVVIDYEKNILVIHSKLPKKEKGYIKSKLEFIRSLVCVKSNFVIKGKKYRGNFLMDTGSEMAVILDSAWLNKQNFPKDLTQIKSSFFKDPRGITYENKIVQSPLLVLNGFELANVPTNLLAVEGPVGFGINYFGNDLLKRFNTIIDFKEDNIYLKPNSLMNLPYRDER